MLIYWRRLDQDPLNEGHFPCREDLELRPRDLELFFPYREDTSMEYGLWACSASYFHIGVHEWRIRKGLRDLVTQPLV